VAGRGASGRGSRRPSRVNLVAVCAAEGVACEELAVLYVVSPGGRWIVRREWRGSAPNFLGSDR
jgi:hypothetical protein